jgi:hypothetical protein
MGCIWNDTKIFLYGVAIFATLGIVTIFFDPPENNNLVDNELF